MDDVELMGMARDFTPYQLFSKLLDHRIVIAGGWLRWLAERTHADVNEAIGRRTNLPDIDVFGADAETLSTLAYELAHHREVEVVVTDNALTVPGGLYDVRPFPVQFILRHTYTSPEAVINSFDFTCCQVAFFWGDNWGSGGNALEVLAGAEFFEHVAERKLVYTGASGTVSGTLLRVLKYAAKGYGIEAAEYAAIIARFVREVYPDSTDLREDQLHERASERLHDYRPYIY